MGQLVRFARVIGVSVAEQMRLQVRVLRAHGALQQFARWTITVIAASLHLRGHECGGLVLRAGDRVHIHRIQTPQHLCVLRIGARTLATTRSRTPEQFPRIAQQLSELHASEYTA